MEQKKKARVIAFYLPQFHPIPENDKWWGKGFTEWTNVRKAKAYHKGQYQPRVPLNNNYYDLRDVSTLMWQANLAEEYGIYGFCFYHYWFAGKLLLEKPAELLLENKCINMQFCFSWANEPWARTWDGKNKQVLMPQDYGGEVDWEKHFMYLLSFFKDERYIKINGKPMFLIYKSTSIEHCAEMMDYWNHLATQYGFGGIHFVKTLKFWFPEKRNLPFSAQVEFEPVLERSRLGLWNKRIRRYTIKVINKMFSTEFPENAPILFAKIVNESCENYSPKGTYPCVFMGWDNSPRRGVAANYVTAPTKQEFKDFLLRKIEIGRKVYETDYLFVNAWNEWAEGTYLEPDELHKYEYLEAIKEVLK